MFKKPTFFVLLTFTVLLLSVSSVFAQEPISPTDPVNAPPMIHVYKGVRMMQEQLMKLKGSTPYYCVQEVTAETVAKGVSNTFYCYDTFAESARKYDQMRPALDLLFNKNSSAIPSEAIGPAVAGHWAVSAQVAYSGLIKDIYGACDAVTNASMYSMRRWDNPTFSLVAYTDPYFTGAPYIISQDQYWLTFPFYSVKVYNQDCI